MDNNSRGPLVSFIITYFNQPAAMLRKCVESIIALSLTDVEREIIIVDDGSENCPLNELADYRDHLIYIRQRSGGLGSARNTGIEISKGKYIQLISSDSTLAMSSYEHCLDIIRYNSRTDIVMFETTSKLPTQAVFQNDPPVSGAVYMHNYDLHVTACGYLFRKSILGGLRFTSGTYHEDEAFTPQLILRAENIIRTDAEACLYRKHENMAEEDNSARDKLKSLNDMEQIILHLNDLAGKMPHNEHIALQRCVHQLTIDYIYKVIRLTHSRKQLDCRLLRLRQNALFPLPQKNYTAKYKALNLMTRHKVTRNLLLFLNIH